MTGSRLSSAVVSALLTLGLMAIAPAKVSAQQTVVLPEHEMQITMTGCFLRMEVYGHDKYVLVNPTVGPATSVPEATCSARGDEPMVELEDVHDNVHKHHLDKGKLGHWVEVSGRLEKIDKGPRDLREVHVRSYRLVPVVAPRVAESLPAPAPAPPAIAPPAAPPLEVTPAPVGTTGVQEQLPKTASPLPLVVMIGVLALAGGLALRLRVA